MANTGDGVPEFDVDGLLPIGIWRASEAEFERRFVSDFLGSHSRREIFDGFNRLRQEIVSLGLQGWHWVDGSYVTTKIEPEDLDVVTFVDADQADALSAEEQTIVLDLLDSHQQTQARYRCDTHYVPIRRPDDPLYLTYMTEWESKNKLFGRTNVKKTGIDLPKGFIDLAILGIGQLTSSDTNMTNQQNLQAGAARSEVEWSASFLEEHLASRLGILEVLEKSGDSRFSTQLHVKSLRNETVSLRQKIAAARLLESNLDAELVIEGNPVVEHRVGAKFLGRLLAFVQDLVEDLTIGSAPSRLEVVSFTPSSFKAAFILSKESNNQQELEYDEEDISGADILSNILDGRVSNSVVIDTLHSIRLRRSYANMLQLIGKNGATVSFRTRQNPLGATVSPVQAMERSLWMRQLEVRKEKFSVAGELVTGSLRKGRFEIQDSNGTVFTGRASKEVANQNRGIRLGSNVRAVIEKMTRNHIDLDVPIVTYSLVSLVDASLPTLDL